MSDHVLPETGFDAPSVEREPRRARTLLVLGLVAGPVLALGNQELIYAADTYTCGHGGRWAMQIIPALCVLLTLAAGVGAYVAWRAVGRGVEDEHEGVASRSRFLGMLGIAISSFSALVIIAQWAAIVAFAPCMRA